MQNLISNTLSGRFFPLKNFRDNFKDPDFLVLKEYLKDIAAELSELFPEEKYYAKAYTGNGRMPLVPWVGLHSKKEDFNSKPETGLYLTLLWQADGSGFCAIVPNGIIFPEVGMLLNYSGGSWPPDEWEDKTEKEYELLLNEFLLDEEWTVRKWNSWTKDELEQFLEMAENDQ